MSFFVSESIKNLVYEDSFANQFNNLGDDLKFFLYSNDELIFEKLSFESIEFKNNNPKNVCFAIKQKIVSNLFLKSDLFLEVKIIDSKPKKYEVEIINITNINDDNYYCKFNIFKEV